MTITRNVRLMLITTILVASIFICQTVRSFTSGYLVIVNKNVSENTLSRRELQSIYLGEKIKWENKKYIKLVLLEDGVTNIDFLQTVVGKTPSQFDQHWMRLVTTGRAAMPPTFTEPPQVINYVAGHPNAIGVVPAGQVNGSVKILAIK